MVPSDSPDDEEPSGHDFSDFESSESPLFSKGDEEGEWIDLSVLKEGYRPIPGSSYELTKRLDDGRSGFGQVWKGYSDRLRRSAAFKFCKRPFDRESLFTLHNELRLVRDLDHPGIVRLEAEYLDSEIPFLQYEFIEGADLSKLLAERFREGGGGPLTPDHAAALILKLVNIMAAPHSRRLPIVHKDLKPQNILVSNYHDLLVFKELGVSPELRLASLKVMDFGIGAHSRYGHGATTGSRSIGRRFEGFRTLAYASPQQSKGLPAHESDDVFAIGVIWFELLIGEMGKGTPIGRHWTQERDELKLRGLTEKQLDVLERCLEPSRQHRIQNAVKLAEEIRGAYADADHVPSLTAVLDEGLKARRYGDLYLNGLTTLSVEIAEALARWKGRLYLNGLTTLSVEVADALASGQHIRYKGFSAWKRPFGIAPELHLDGLTLLPVEVAGRSRQLERRSPLPRRSDHAVGRSRRCPRHVGR